MSDTGRRLSGDYAEARDRFRQAARVRRGMGEGVRYDGLTCEFGTQPNLQALAALRPENRLHHWAASREDHPAKAAMRAAFAPREARWEAAVLGHAREMHVLCHALVEA
ncbi:MAG: DUF2817 domain-containing protein [Deltaproteobacteria bacterium]|nr:DUF2817 domain-containing protein [Deltaproteobacteria bacterium]